MVSDFPVFLPAEQSSPRILRNILPSAGPEPLPPLEQPHLLSPVNIRIYKAGAHPLQQDELQHHPAECPQQLIPCIVACPELYA